MKELKVKNLRVHKSLENAKNVLKKAALGVIIAATMATTTACGNREFDTTYDFENAVLANAGNSVVVPIKKWKDYKGEAIQIITPDNMAILTSSYFASLIKGESASNIAENYANCITDNNGTVSHYAETNKQDAPFNYQILDFQNNFDKAIIINGNRAVILPVAYWKDFSGEQIQIILPDKTPIVLSNYNTMLISDNKSERKAIDLAKMIVGENGKVTDFAGDYQNPYYNKNFFDFQRSFNRAIALGDSSNCILPLNTWKDYEDGEQFQIKVEDGPTYVCSSFNTILMNDTGGEISAEDIASALNSHTVNYAEDSSKTSGSYNKQWFDFDNSFQNATINNGSNSVILPLEQWRDYDGEQLQFVLPNGVTILSSSIDSTMAAHNVNGITIDDISESLVGIEGSTKNLDPDYEKTGYNKTFWDTKYNFPYALVVRDDSILILSVDSWKDYPGGEALQLNLTDKSTTFLTTAYDTKLVNLGNSGLNIRDVANWFTNGEKKIVDLSTDTLGTGKHHNYSIFDTKYTFNYALAVNGDTASIIPITQWTDYDGDKNSDGDYTDYTEQLQITLGEGQKIYSDNTNIKLIYSDNPEMVKEIAKGHVSESGTVNDFVAKGYTKLPN